MKHTTLIKLIKILRTTRIAIPLALLLVGVATKIALTGVGDPSGDPIEDDPVPE
jgi:hypothetical protein